MIGIIGAGFTGLAAALKLCESGERVVLLEKNDEVGGMVADFRFFDDKETLEYIYHHVFTSDKYVVELCEKLGASDKLITHEPKDALYIDGKLYPFTSPIDLIMFKPLAFIDRIRMGLTVLKAGRLRDWEKLEGTLASEWLLKNVGKTSYERVWKPLLKSKFADDYEKVSAVWIWNKFKLRGNTRGKDISKEQLGYFEGGFGELARLTAKYVQSIGGEIICGADVKNIAKTGEQYEVSYSVGEEEKKLTFDKVITTLPGQLVAPMTKGVPFDEDTKKRMSAIDSKANICVCLLLKKPVSGYYWNTVCDDMPFVALVEHTNLIKEKDYGGTVVYLSRYINADDTLYTNDEEKTVEEFENAFLKMFPHISEDDVIDARIFKTRYSQPVVECDYSKKMPHITTSEKGFFTVGMAQIYPEDRGINYAIRSGYEAAQAALDDK